jgi:hypothetical protein
VRLYVRAHCPDPDDCWARLPQPRLCAQRLTRADSPPDELAFLTPAMPEDQTRQLLAEWGLALDAVMRIYE